MLCLPKMIRRKTHTIVNDISVCNIMIESALMSDMVCHMKCTDGTQHH